MPAVLWRAAVRRLEHGVVLADVAAGGETHPAHELRAEVADDVAEQVAGGDHAVVLRVLDQPHAHRVDVGLPQLDAREVLRHLARRAHHQAAGLAHDVGFLHHRHVLIAMLLRIFKGVAHDAVRAALGDDAAGNSDLIGGHVLELRHGLAVVQERLAHRVGQREELHPGVEVLRVLAEHDEVDVVTVVQRVAGVGLAGAQVGRQVEHLAQAHDWRAIDQTPALQFRRQFALGLFLGLARDRAKQRAGGVLQQLHRALRQRVALRPPDLPADVAMNILRIDAQRVQHLARHMHHVNADPVAG